MGAIQTKPAGDELPMHLQDLPNTPRQRTLNGFDTVWVVTPNEKLKAGAEHVMYERKMLIHTFRECQVIDDDPNLVPDGTRFAILESFMIHYRNLLEFLRQPNNGTIKDDVKASDFAPGYEPLELPNKYRSDLNKRLAHITYTRLGSGKMWENSNMVAELEVSWNSFLEQIDDEIREWFQPVKELEVGRTVSMSTSDGDGVSSYIS